VAYDYDETLFLTPTPAALVVFGAKDTARIKYHFELWRLLTPMLLHANLWHLASNMVFQLILGFRLEPSLGASRFAGVYILSGLGGILFSCLVSPNSLGVGASTALYGMLGAMIAWIAVNWSATVNNPNRNCTMIMLVVIAIFNLLIGLSSANIDVWGHVGGFFTGMMIGVGLATYADPVP
jgi:rhomboid protease GluP